VAEPPLELPPLQQADLDAATLEQLFFDLASGTELLDITYKGGATRMAGDPHAADVLSLAAARDALVIGAVTGVQIRYRHQGREWWDTILRTPSGFRLVRISRDGVA
jgi:hypothetical protein